MNNELNKAFQLVSQSSTIKQGQSQIAYLRKNLAYPMELLMYMSNNQNLQGQLRAAIELKIWCQMYNNLEIFQRDAYQQIIQDVKEKIIVAYLSFDKKISETLRPAIVKLTTAEFPTKWSGLMQGLVNYVSVPENSGSILSVLLLIQEITLKYTYLGRSDPLYEQIILVCDQIHDFLLSLTLSIINSPLNPSILLILQSLMNIFYHLNYQDLHPKFQDNLNNWMGILKTVMNYQNTSEEVFKCKGAALESILLYASKYKEDVESSIKGFSSEIWNLCSNATQDMEYDSIVFNCLKYFKSIILWVEMKQFFIDNLGELIQKLIIPNLKIDKSKIQMFFEQPDLFFQYYFKNNQIQTRRSASLDLVRVICRNFPNFQSYCLSMLQNYTQNMQSSSVNEKCNLLNFLIDSSSKSFRQIDGCTQTFLSPSLLTQCYDHIIKPDLGQIYQWLITNQNKMIQDQIGMILLVTLMRFVYFFRIYITTDNYQLIIKLVSKINTASNSIRTMVFMVINAYVTVRHGDFTHFRNLKYYWNAENTHAIATDILVTIYKNDQHYPMLNQNLTRMLYTLSKTLGASSVQYYDYFDQLFRQMLARTLQFDFKSVLLLFESIGILAFWTAKSGGSPKERLQGQIFQYLQVAIKRNSDLLNFCFQILAIFLQFQSNQSNKHQQIYVSILDPSNWIQQNISVMSSYIQYISSYLSRSTNSIINDKEKFQGVLMKLVQLEHFDLFFRFLESIIKITNVDAFYQMGYFQLAVHGTENIVQRSIAGKKQGLMFIFKLMSIYDTGKVLNYITAISPHMFQSIINDSRQIIRTIQFRKDRKYMYAALTQVISMGVLQSQMEGNLLGLLVDNSTNRFMASALRDPLNNATQKKQSTYQKLQIFSQLEPKQSAFDVDEQQQLCKTYLLCQKRPSFQYLNNKNHERMNRLLEKHGKNLNLKLN